MTEFKTKPTYRSSKGQPIIIQQAGIKTLDMRPIYDALPEGLTCEDVADTIKDFRKAFGAVTCLQIKPYLKHDGVQAFAILLDDPGLAPLTLTFDSESLEVSATDIEDVACMVSSWPPAWIPPPLPALRTKPDKFIGVEAGYPNREHYLAATVEQVRRCQETALTKGANNRGKYLNRCLRYIGAAFPDLETLEATLRKYLEEVQTIEDDSSADDVQEEVSDAQETAQADGDDADDAQEADGDDADDAQEADGDDADDAQEAAEEPDSQAWEDDDDAPEEDADVTDEDPPLEDNDPAWDIAPRDFLGAIQGAEETTKTLQKVSDALDVMMADLKEHEQGRGSQWMEEVIQKRVRQEMDRREARLQEIFGGDVERAARAAAGDWTGFTAEQVAEICALTDRPLPQDRPEFLRDGVKGLEHAAQLVNEARGEAPAHAPNAQEAAVKDPEWHLEQAFLLWRAQGYSVPGAANLLKGTAIAMANSHDRVRRFLMVAQGTHATSSGLVVEAYSERLAQIIAAAQLGYESWEALCRFHDEPPRMMEVDR